MAANPNDEDKKNEKSGLFFQLRNLAVKLDKKLPQIKQELIHPRRDHSCNTTVFTEFKAIKYELTGLKVDAAARLAELTTSSNRFADELKDVKTNILTIEADLNSITQYLKKFGFSIDQFESKTNAENGVHTPTKSTIEKYGCTPNVTRNSKTPDLDTFGLSSPTVRLIYSQSITPKSRLTKHKFSPSGFEKFLDFNLDTTPRKEATKSSETPETPELTISNSLKQPKIDSLRKKFEELSAIGKFNITENITPEEPELTYHKFDFRDNDDLPPTPKFDIKYSFL